MIKVFCPVSRLHKYAFTLAEVLITVGIIGVVASLTMPTVIGSYQKQANITLLRKTMNDFETALDTYITEEGKTKLSHTEIYQTDGIEKFMNAKFNARKINNFASSYQSISGRTRDFSCSNLYTLPSGAAVCFTSLSYAATGQNLIADFTVYIDVNGTKKPNIGGRDMFTFYISHESGAIKSLGPLDDSEICDIESGTLCQRCLDKEFGQGCISLLQNNNWKMNY